MKTSLRILFSIALAIAFLFLTNAIVSEGYKRYNVDKYVKFDEIFHRKTYHDLLFIGSSRTHTSINPRIIDSITESSSYNAGIEGGGLLEFKLAFEGYLETHANPKKLILTLDAYSFAQVDDFYNFTLYFPFLDNKVVDTTLTANGHNTILLKILPFLILTELDDYSKRNAIAGLLGDNELTPGNFHYKGYLSNGTKCIDFSLDKLYSNNYAKIEQEAILKLYSIIQNCKERNIDLIVTYAPEYNQKLQKTIYNFMEFVKLVEEITKSNNILFYRDDQLEICLKECFFANYGHLNTAGATAYSVILGNRIKGLNHKSIP